MSLVEPPVGYYAGVQITRISLLVWLEKVGDIELVRWGYKPTYNVWGSYYVWMFKKGRTMI